MTGVSSADNLLGCTLERGRGKQRDRWWDSAIGLALFCNCIYLYELVGSRLEVALGLNLARQVPAMRITGRTRTADTGAVCR